MLMMWILSVSNLVCMLSSEQVVGFHQLADDSPEISSLISPKSRKGKKIVILVAAMIEVHLLACWVIFHDFVVC